MKHVAVRNIKRADKAVVAELAGAGCATVYEARGRAGLLKPDIRPIYADANLGGSAVTVLVPPSDNWMIHVALELCQAGDVLVVACTSDCSDSFLGDLMATSAQAQGVVGMVTETGVRDTTILKQMNFPVWSRGICARSTLKKTLGAVNVPIVCGGQLVFPGDVVVADNDGVVITPRAAAVAVRDKMRTRLADEEVKTKKLANGELSLDLDNMRPRLKDAGLVYVESLDELGEWDGIDCRGRG